MEILTLRAMSEEEARTLRELASSRTVEARLRDRARICWLASQGQRVSAIKAEFGVADGTVRLGIRRFNAGGLDGLRDRRRGGRPATYPPEQVGELIAASLTDPQALGLPFASWTLDRLSAYRHEERGIPMKRSRIAAASQPDRGDPAGRGLALAAAGDLVRRTARPGLRRKKGAIVTLYTAPPAESLVICLDEMGPESAKSFPGPRVVPPDPDGERRPRATQEIDYGRRGAGYIFGAFVPATGAALTAPDAGRTTANFVDFLGRVEAWLDPTVARVYAVLDNLSAHRALDVLLWALAHPRWEFVFQPTYAAYLNLIEPWWKVLRSLALKGRRFETWDEVCRAVEDGTRYWNAHRHSFVWGRRQRRRPARPTGVTRLPLPA